MARRKKLVPVVKQFLFATRPISGTVSAMIRSRYPDWFMSLPISTTIVFAAIV